MVNKNTTIRSCRFSLKAHIILFLLYPVIIPFITISRVLHISMDIIRSVDNVGGPLLTCGQHSPGVTYGDNRARNNGQSTVKHNPTGVISQ